MGYKTETGEVFETPSHGVIFEFANPCCEMGHEYAEKICPTCGRDFCFSCCGTTNVHEGGKYQNDCMTCPKCGADYYAATTARNNAMCRFEAEVASLEDAANARLIAAAPDLLEACKYAFENLRPHGNVKKDFRGHNAMGALSRAIDKATGKEVI